MVAAVATHSPPKPLALFFGEPFFHHFRSGFQKIVSLAEFIKFASRLAAGHQHQHQHQQ